MNKRSQTSTKISSLDYQSLSKKLAIGRIGFGIIWAIDAAFKFEPVFYRGFLSMVKAKDSGEPSWLNPWYHTWYNFIGSNQHLFAVIIIVSEALLAISLILGLARRPIYLMGGLLSFLIWGVGEGFGGPYVSGSTDVGAGVIYIFVFALLYFSDGIIKPSYALDSILSKRYVWWQNIANFKLSTLTHKTKSETNIPKNNRKQLTAA